nr:MAG TPA: hypothetical protein [Caudoviricetes sp.]
MRHRNLRGSIYRNAGMRLCNGSLNETVNHNSTLRTLGIHIVQQNAIRIAGTYRVTIRFTGRGSLRTVFCNRSASLAYAARKRRSVQRKRLSNVLGVVEDFRGASNAGALVTHNLKCHLLSTSNIRCNRFSGQFIRSSTGFANFTCKSASIVKLIVRTGRFPNRRRGRFAHIISFSSLCFISGVRRHCLEYRCAVSIRECFSSICSKLRRIALPDKLCGIFTDRLFTTHRVKLFTNRSNFFGMLGFSGFSFGAHRLDYPFALGCFAHCLIQRRFANKRSGFFEQCQLFFGSHTIMVSLHCRPVDFHCKSLQMRFLLLFSQLCYRETCIPLSLAVKMRFNDFSVYDFRLFRLSSNIGIR